MLILQKQHWTVLLIKPAISSVLRGLTVPTPILLLNVALPATFRLASRTVVPPTSETRPVVYCGVEIVSVPPKVFVKPTVPVCALSRFRLAPLLMWNNPSLAP